MMNWTSYQREVLSCQTLGKVKYRNMWHTERNLGYGSKGTSEYYDVNIANDVPTTEIRDLILLHEIGHIYYHHLDVDIDKEIINVKHLFETLGKPYKLIRHYGGPCKFLNVAMDIEVNSKVYTYKNLETLNIFFNSFNSHPLTADLYDIEIMDDFRDYYIPLIERLEENKEDSKGDEDDDFDSSDIPIDLDDSDFDEFVKQALEEEGYSLQESDEEVVGEETKEDLIERSFSVNYTETPEVRIYNFLISILKKMSLEYQKDAIKNYNRGTRKNREGILYPSNKRKISKGNRRICFILDVSSSMDISAILKAITSLKGVIRAAAPGSMIVTWDYKLIQEFPIDEIPNEIELGSFTDIARALEWVRNNGFTDCVVYSDFYTEFKPLEVQAELMDRLYAIEVGPNKEKNARLGKFYSCCKELLKLT
jgi:predicted metal-dependent peptidase